MEEKTCPAIWNKLIMTVPWNMALVGFLIPQPLVVVIDDDEVKLPLLPDPPPPSFSFPCPCPPPPAEAIAFNLAPNCSLTAKKTTQYPATKAN